MIIQLPPLLETNDLLSFGNEGKKFGDVSEFLLESNSVHRGAEFILIFRKKKKSKNKREINDSSSERTYGRVRFSSARKIKQGTGGRGGEANEDPY